MVNVVFIFVTTPWVRCAVQFFWLDVRPSFSLHHVLIPRRLAYNIALCMHTHDILDVQALLGLAMAMGTWWAFWGMTVVDGIYLAWSGKSAGNGARE